MFELRRAIHSRKRTHRGALSMARKMQRIKKMKMREVQT